MAKTEGTKKLIGRSLGSLLERRGEKEKTTFSHRQVGPAPIITPWLVALQKKITYSRILLF